MRVYVRSQSGKWLMPTNPANARILIRQGKAMVIQRTPFAIRLLFETTEYTQPIVIGIDDGGVRVGIATVSDDKVLYQEELILRTDIRKLMDIRKQYRRSRRNRKTRYRKSRFLNRKASLSVCKVCGGNAPKSKGICRACLRRANGIHQRYARIRQSVFRLPPSIRAKKNAIIRAVKNIPLPVPVLINLEDTYFDLHAMENQDITGKQYQHGPLMYHKNFKSACLTRDGHKCRICGSEKNLEVHHIRAKSEGGTDRLQNLMTLCKTCHARHHKAGLGLPQQKSSSYVSEAHVQQGKNYLQVELGKISDIRVTFGYITAYFRNKAGLSKSHVCDAVIIANKDARPEPGYFGTKHVRLRKRSLHEAIARKGRKEPNRIQRRNNKNVFRKGNFRRWDTVRYMGKVGFISGFAGGNNCRLTDTAGKYIRNPARTYNQVSLKNVRLIHRNNAFLRHFCKDA